MNAPTTARNFRYPRMGRKAFPTWMENGEIRERVLRVYAAYLDHTPVAVICVENNMSATLFYKDLTRARQELRYRFETDMQHICMEQVATRRAVINRIYVDYDQMTASTEVPLARKQEIHMEQLRLILQNETAIAELLMVGGMNGAVNDLPPQADRVLVIDLSSRDPAARRQLSAPIKDETDRRPVVDAEPDPHLDA